MTSSSLARALEHVRYLPPHISFGLGNPGDRALIRLDDGSRYEGVVAYDAVPTEDDFLFSVRPTNRNWFSPAGVARIRYDRIAEIRCGTFVWSWP
jgi:hypothetical protein